MNGKVYVGQKALSLTEYDKSSPITGIILWVDDENCYEAGDESGTVIEQDCPYATQAMADALLSALQGYEYKGLEADGAKVTPIAELGDGITVNGVYTQLAYQNIRFSSGEVMDVSAPGNDETLHEYKTEGETTRYFNHQIAETRSQITKTSEEIKLLVESEIDSLAASITVQIDNITQRVNGLDGAFAEVSLTLDGLTVTDSSGTTKIKGSSIETETLYVNAANISGKLSANQIELTGSITWADLASDAQSQVTTAQNNANSAITTATNAYNAAWNANANASAAQDSISGWTYTGTTYIDGEKLMTGTVTATKLQGGSVQLIDNLKTTQGTIYIRDSATGGAAIEVHSNGALSLSAQYGVIYLDASGGHVQISGARLRANGSNTSDLGASGLEWRDIYLNNSPSVTSDNNAKRDIELLPDKYIGLFDFLEPKRFRMNAGTSNRYHTGFIAQDLKAGMDANGINPDELAAWCLGEDEQGETVQSIRYEELIAIAWAKIKMLESRISDLEGAK